MSDEPDFRDLVGDEGSPEELERLRRVHELLVAAGPPPELPPAMREAPATTSRVLSFPSRRRLQAALVAAAAAVGLAFGIGYLVGSGGGFPTEFRVPMHGVGEAAAARAAIRIGEQDKQGNWPLLMTVRGLKPLPAGGYYELWLTRKGKPAASCGTFNAAGKSTTVRLNAPYLLKEYDGWIVTAHRPGVPDTHQILMTT